MVAVRALEGGLAGALEVQPEEDMPHRRAMLLSGSLGLGHEMLVRSCGAFLETAGWSVRHVDCMRLLGSISGAAGELLFTRVVRRTPGLYDAIHFAHLRPGTGVSRLLDRAASRRLLPALDELIRAEEADLVLSVFATGASAAAKLKARGSISAATAVLCTDVTFHSLWVHPGTDLFLATSEAAEASIRRYLPRARVAVVPRPVRRAFYDAPERDKARAELGISPERPCVLLLDSGWGMGRLERYVGALGTAGIDVLAVAGRRADVADRFRAIAAGDRHVHPFGFVDNVPLLMAACDCVVALPGATTCSEARVVGRPLLLIDVMPGHGRENLVHELDLGTAWPCGASASDIVGAVTSLLSTRAPTARRQASREPWEPAFGDALATLGFPAPPGDHSHGATGQPRHLNSHDTKRPEVRQ